MHYPIGGAKCSFGLPGSSVLTPPDMETLPPGLTFELGGLPPLWR